MSEGSVIQLHQLWADSDGTAEVLSITCARGGTYMVMQRRRGNPFLVNVDQLLRYWRPVDPSDIEGWAPLVPFDEDGPTREVFRVEYVPCPKCKTHIGYAHHRCCEKT